MYNPVPLKWRLADSVGTSVADMHQTVYQGKRGNALNMQAVANAKKGQEVSEGQVVGEHAGKV